MFAYCIFTIPFRFLLKDSNSFTKWSCVDVWCKDVFVPMPHMQKHQCPEYLLWAVWPRAREFRHIGKN